MSLAQNHMPHSLGQNPGEFCRAIGLHPSHFKPIWDLPGRPEVTFNRGPTGRITRIRPTPQLAAFFLRNKSYRSKSFQPS